MPATLPPDCFIDSNIWLYAFIQGNTPSKTAISRTLIETSRPIISTQVINEVCVNLLRRAKFSEEQIQHLITSFYQKYPVLDLNLPILLLASRLRQHYSLSFWDSAIVAGALSGGVPVLYSEDMQHGLVVEGQLEIRNPFLAE